jgi:hypothetical protein
MVKMENSCLQHQGTVVFDTHPLCVTLDRSSYPKVRLFFLSRRSHSNTTLSGSLSKKASTISVPLASLKHSSISALSFSTTRYKDWDDILTAHSDEAYARTWSMLNKRLGKHALGAVENGKSRTPGMIKASPWRLPSLSRAQHRNRLSVFLHVGISDLLVPLQVS